MCILLTHENGWILSHQMYIRNVYKNSDDSKNYGYQLCDSLFSIFSPFLRDGQKNISIDQRQNINSRKPKRKRSNSVSSNEIPVNHVYEIYNELRNLSRKSNCFLNSDLSDDKTSNNLTARESAKEVYETCNNTLNFHGGVSGESFVITKIQDDEYIIPPHCRFFCYDVNDMNSQMELLNPPFDFVLLDPPWWNKYIRRKKAVCEKSAYHMMYNEELIKLPIKSLTLSGSLVAVWCTNSENHITYLKNELFPAWGLTYVGKWYWIKVTQTGETVCEFREPPGKQPFEQILFGYVQCPNREQPLPEDGKVIISVPSAIHSHKPPLTDVLSGYLPHNPRCMEIFARYLLPGWTSWGNEVLKLQHVSLYEQIKNEKEANDILNEIKRTEQS